MKDVIENIIYQSGLWDKERRRSHSFIISPDIYYLNRKEQRQLEQIRTALYDCLKGLSLIAQKSLNPKESSGRVWGVIRRVWRTDVPRSYRIVQLQKEEQIPEICKVDFIKDERGRLWISEIDGYNKRGLGYVYLINKIAIQLYPQIKKYPGLFSYLNDLSQQFGYSDVWMLIWTATERFYDPEFQVLARESQQQKIIIKVVSEDNFKKGTKRQYVDLPIIANQRIREYLLNQYLKNKSVFLIPPKPYISSKSVWALLKNSQQDKDIEKILREHILISSLKLLRQHIPQTYFIFSDNVAIVKKNNYLIKKALSSGAKGVYFPEDIKHNSIFEQRDKLGYLYILQEIIKKGQERFRYYDEQGNVYQDDFAIRLTVHFAPNNIIGAAVTAGQGQIIHGSINSLQMGVGLEPEVNN